eukprot:Skav234267  [mRNA]  locus=scaffold1464:965962:974543:+ [translate_table: standard]
MEGSDAGEIRQRRSSVAHMRLKTVRQTISLGRDRCSFSDEDTQSQGSSSSQKSRPLQGRPVLRLLAELAESHDNLLSRGWSIASELLGPCRCTHAIIPWGPFQLASSLDGLGGPLSTALLLAFRHWMGTADIQLEGLALVLPVFRDVSLLLLLNRLLRAGQTAAELMYSSRILSTQRRELWQNTRERRVIACLLGRVLEDRSGEETVRSLRSELVFGYASAALEPLDATAPLAFERACAELITAGSPGSDLWLSIVKLSEEPAEADRVDPYQKPWRLA